MSLLEQREGLLWLSVPPFQAAHDTEDPSGGKHEVDDQKPELEVQVQEWGSGKNVLARGSPLSTGRNISNPLRRGMLNLCQRLPSWRSTSASSF